MNNFDFKNITSVHFIGIGGIGMSAIAKILQNKGFNISGSDANESENIEYLRKLNIDIFIGHSAKNISNQDVVVYSSAVTNSNPEMIEAKNKNIPTIRRAEFLGKLIKLWPFRIGIAGTHGKTTTSSIASILFMEANLDPTFIIGGILQNVNTNALLGTGEYIIYEADEYDRTFLALPPTYSIITNIEMDHSDIYSDIEDMKETFTKFANSTSENGFTVLCGDDENIQKIMPNIRRKIISYGFDKKSDYKIEFIGTNEQTSKFKIYFRNELLDIFEINALGNHNILNASAVIALAHQLKISTAKIKNGILK
ncbi:MAG: UDP-N-acetylmuramate--L-alanine ligase, partial [Candidatus Marinimicrobia bacterium]|nr:UDP-N-acetylmuramate--L-alanine ligase [Candidatus Neomarinimicrobiota bacterium]